MKRYFLFVCLITWIGACAQKEIPATFYGENFWYTKYNNAPSGSNQDFVNWNLMKESGAKLVRVGGRNYNYYATSGNRSYPSTPVGYVTIVDDIRKHGCEPVITVPFDGNMGDINTEAGYAAQIVHTLNVIHKRNVKYFIIANEPGIDYTWYTYSTHTNAQGADICAYIKAFVIAMRNVDPKIKIIGPDLEGNYPNILEVIMGVSGTGYDVNALTGNIPAAYNNESTGQAEGLPWLDFLSYHNYGGNSFTIAGRADYIQDGYNQSDDSKYTAYTLPPHMKLMIDEFNLKLNGDAPGQPDCNTDPTQTKCSHLNGDGLEPGSSSPIDYFDIDIADPNSFLAGQYIVDMMAGMLKSGNVATCNIWSGEESTAHGYLFDDGTNQYRKPTYWHYWLMANYFKGTYYDNANVPTGTFNYPTNPFWGLKGFGCVSSEYVAVLVTNQHTAAQNYTIDLNSGGTGSAGHLRFAMGISSISGISFPQSIPAKSTYMLFFDCSGNYQGRYELRQATGSSSPNDGMTDNPSGYDLTDHFRNTSGSWATCPITILNPYADSYTKCLGDHTTGITDLGSGDVYTCPEHLSVSSSNLSPGLYEVEYTGTCGTAKTVFSVHETSPVVDAGPDLRICTSATTYPSLGNDALPDQTGGLDYVWTGTTTPTEDAEGDNADITSIGVFLQSVDNGTCADISDEVRVIPVKDGELMVKDNYEDIGEQPNPTAVVGWRSPDIWVRHNNDGLSNQHSHEDPGIRAG